MRSMHALEENRRGDQKGSRLRNLIGKTNMISLLKEDLVSKDKGHVHLEIVGVEIISKKQLVS